MEERKFWKFSEKGEENWRGGSEMGCFMEICLPRDRSRMNESAIFYFYFLLEKKKTKRIIKK